MALLQQHNVYLMIWLYCAVRYTKGVISDPCVNYVTLPNLSTRNPSNVISWDSKGLCDRYIGDRWYRTEGSNMTTKPPAYWSCGTMFPIWLAGSFPPNDGFEYERKACVNSFLGICSTVLPIKIKNCGSFYVYYLVSSRACPIAYCFTPNKVDKGISESKEVLYKHKEVTNIHPDPCNNYTDLTNMHERQTRSSEKICDKHLEEKWYRSDGSVMARSPRRLSCGTKYPVWLADLPPPQDGREHTLRVCMKYPRDVCARTWNIKVKNCGTFSVYSLKPTEICPSAYCFVPQRHQNLSIQNPDPCSTYTTIPKQKGRTLSKKQKSNKRAQICDAYLQPGWYRYKKGDIVTTPPLIGSCGTIFPIWLRGNLPLNDTREHTLTACQVTHKEDCASSLKIKVKNCGKFNVYFLSPTKSCPSAYCFERRQKKAIKKVKKSNNSVNWSKNKKRKTDPCKNNVPLPNMKARAGKRSCSTSRTNVMICDRNLEKRWYKVMGRTISTKPPKLFTCGTRMPIWLEDPLPQNDGIEHSLKVCTVSRLGQCSWRAEIKVKNCGKYFVYYLVPTEICPSAYCFVSCSQGD